MGRIFKQPKPFSEDFMNDGREQSVEQERDAL